MIITPGLENFRMDIPIGPCLPGSFNPPSRREEKCILLNHRMTPESMARLMNGVLGIKIEPYTAYLDVLLALDYIQPRIFKSNAGDWIWTCRGEFYGSVYFSLEREELPEIFRISAPDSLPDSPPVSQNPSKRRRSLSQDVPSFDIALCSGGFSPDHKKSRK